jgi:hypothetical protein
VGLGVVEGLADGIPPDAEELGDLANALAVAVGLPDGREVVHRTHPSSLRPAGLGCRQLQGLWYGGPGFDAEGGPELDADHHRLHSGPETAPDPDLTRVIDAWPDLPPHIRAAVLALVGSSHIVTK